MFGLPRRSPVKRLAAVAASTSLLATIGIAATAGPASADSVINVHYAVTGTVYLAKLSTTVSLGSGNLAVTDDLTTGAVSSELTLPPSTVSTKVLGFIPVTATAEMTQNGPATGTVSGNNITSTASVSMKLTSLSVAGLNIPVGGNCGTDPFTVSLSSGAGFTISGGGPLSGTFTLPPFHHCGLETFLLNLTIPGGGNTFNVTLGPLQLG
jgi:hypothetical protein